MLLPTRTIAIENTYRTIVRTLPVKGRVVVKKGEKVRPETVVGSCWRVSGFKNYDLGRLFNLRLSRVKETILRSVGAQIYQGTVVARTKKMWGLKVLEFISPISGVLHSFSGKSGVLTIQQAPQEYRLVAGVSGIIDKIVPGESVEISTVVSEVRGSLTAGNDREGVLKIVTNPDIAIVPHVIDESCSGRIIIGGALLSKEVIHKCLALRVRGIVCGGIHWRDFDRVVTQARGLSEDIGITIFITEGFGYQPMRKEVFDFLARSENSFGMILGSSSCLIIPLSGQAKSKAQGMVVSEEEFAVPQKDDIVRLINLPRLDEFGRMKRLLDKPERLESELMVQVCEVEVNGEVRKVPVRNLEIIR
ncbi:hypothetical protein KKB83_04680 [Patescibacteria group bacterium]|nr:hypothetical protein [Patescibacteria group bacterium]